MESPSAGLRETSESIAVHSGSATQESATRTRSELRAGMADVKGTKLSDEARNDGTEET